ncbi:MAG: phosphoribosylamine--glycine ligase, partial [Candidatus Methanofastidiosia archaeon]
GLTGGKGVKVVDSNLEGQLENLEDAKIYAKSVIENRIGGFSKVIVEEKLCGEEFTLQAFVDSKNVVPMPIVQDHKFACVGDTGPFTGGMGSYSCKNHLLPFMTKMDFENALKTLKQIVEALRKEGIYYRGILYGQFMLTKEESKIVELNVRFGDPEAMNVLPILETDFVETFEKTAQGKLGKTNFQNLATVCKYVVPKGYPTNPVKNKKIEGDFNASKVYFASVNEKKDGLYTTSSRALAFVGIAKTIEEAEKIAEKGASKIKGDVYYRWDIGKNNLIEKRIQHMKTVRGDLSAF